METSLPKIQLYNSNTDHSESYNSLNTQNFKIQCKVISKNSSIPENIHSQEIILHQVVAKQPI